MNGVRDWWRGLDMRERRAVLLAGLALLLFSLYSGWQSFDQARQQRLERLERQREALRDLSRQAAEIRQLRGQADTPSRSKESLLALVDRSARAQGLGAALKRVKPEGGGVRLWLEKAPFDTLIVWLGRLKSRQGADITALSLERVNDTGLVNARITLERP